MALVANGDVDELAPVRDVRAAEEYLSTVEFVPDMYHVFSEAGTEYTVDVRTGACDCPDAEYRAPPEGCKHLRRVRMERSERPIPVGVDVDTNLLRARGESA